MYNIYVLYMTCANIFIIPLEGKFYPTAHKL